MDLRQKCNDMAQEFDKSMTEMLNDKVSNKQCTTVGVVCSEIHR